MSRTKNSIRNLITAVVGQGIGFVISFIARYFFIKTLGRDYLGLNGLFTNILTILSLAELGVGEAITYSLYKPLAEGDTRKCSMLMQVYKKLYNCIGLGILVIGISLTPFLHLIIKDMPNVQYIELIYILYVVNTAVSYFFSYRRNLIIADQKRYIATFIRYSAHIIFTLLEIIYLIMYHNFIGYLIIMILATLADNIMVSIKAKKMYPYLNNKESIPLDEESKKSIIKNTKAMMMHKVGGVVVNSTDNILLSRIVSLASVGLYSNYYFITNALNSVSQHVFNSVTASVGNMFVMDDKKKQYSIFKDIFFLNFWMFCFISVSLICLFNPFIELWIGKDYLFSFDVVCIIVINFYIYGMRKSVLTFREASGLFYKDRWKSVFEAIINLISSIILAYYFGAFGVFLGTFISSITVCVWVEPLVLFKYGFDLKLREYFKYYFMYLIITLICCILTYCLCSFITIGGFLALFLKAILCLLIPNIIIVLLFKKTKEFQYLKRLIKGLLTRIVKKGKKHEK